MNNVNSLMAEGLVAAEPEASSVREGEVWVRARPGGEGGGRGGGRSKAPEGAWFFNSSCNKGRDEMTDPVNLHTRTWGQQGVFSKAQNVNRATAETCCREISSNIL